ncbi:MAG: acyltransferase [Clostridia bacterium]|nr:acyltransferase [Clostridia bacterium]
MEQNLNSQNKLKKRNLSLDILKILSMIMVIILHTKTYGLQNTQITTYSGVYWAVWILHMFSLVAVNCFVLISGYFISVSAPQPKKIFKLWVQTLIFSIGIYLAIVLSQNINLSFVQFLSQLLPVMSNQYWFFTCYFVLMILSPFLNRLIDSLNQQDFKKFIFVLLFIFMVIPTLNLFGDNFDSSKGYSLTWFIVLYCVGAYIRRFPLPKKPYGIFYIVISMVAVFINALLENLKDVLLLFANLKSILIRYNSATVFFGSVCLFLFFVNKPIYTDKKWGKIITTASLSSFCVYLIHEHPLIRDFIWKDNVKLFEVTDNFGQFLLRLLLAVLSILIIGIIVGVIINKIIGLFEKVIEKLKR